MRRIVLSTLNASYSHPSLGLRYLLANLGPYRANATIREFVINQRPADIVEELLQEKPDVIGFGVYIWNTRETLRVVSILKSVCPDITVVLGGPEVSYESDTQELVRLADYTISGEGDLRFRELLEQLDAGKRPLQSVLVAQPPNVSELCFPYECYTDEDIANRATYVEISRGCPFKCQFCLSSLDQKVRQFNMDGFLEELNKLHQRGARQFRFIDRTFNLNFRVAESILRFFLDRMSPDLFVHFEMVPDRFPEKLKSLVSQFPTGALQFEIGIQTFNDETAALIERKQDVAKTCDNIRFLKEQTGVHIHADLIAGLPGETEESFAKGFDKLLSLGPHEIQVGILKRLRGTPIARHTRTHSMTYNTTAPYEVLATEALSFQQLQHIKRFARAWDLVANSGNFPTTLPLFWENQPSPYHAFSQFTQWLYGQVGAFTGIALQRLAHLVFNYLTEERQFSPEQVGTLIGHDYLTPGRRVPKFLAEFVEKPAPNQSARKLPPRQARHHRNISSVV